MTRSGYNHTGSPCLCVSGLDSTVGSHENITLSGETGGLVSVQPAQQGLKLSLKTEFCKWQQIFSHTHTQMRHFKTITTKEHNLN